MELDLKDLETTFTIGQSAISTSTQSVTSSLKKQSAATLLDITRAQNIGMKVVAIATRSRSHFCDLGIMLARIKLPFADIRRALLQVDDQRLTVDELKSISKHIPTPDEVETVLHPSGPLSDTRYRSTD